MKIKSINRPKNDAYYLTSLESNKRPRVNRKLLKRSGTILGETLQGTPFTAFNKFRAVVMEVIRKGKSAIFVYQGRSKNPNIVYFLKANELLKRNKIDNDTSWIWVIQRRRRIVKIKVSSMSPEAVSKHSDYHKIFGNFFRIV